MSAHPTDSDRVVTAFAPCRVDLSAGFPDVSPFADAEEGIVVVNVAITRGVEVTCGRGSRDLSPLPARLVIETCASLGVELEPIQVEATAPSGVGLGVSGATSVAIARAVSARHGREFDQQALAELGWMCERAAGLAGGTQDQLASAFGGVGAVHRKGEQSYRRSIPVEIRAAG